MATSRQCPAFGDPQAKANSVKRELASVDLRATPDFLPSTSTPVFSHLCSCDDNDLLAAHCHMVICASGMDIMDQDHPSLKQCNAQPEKELS
jgi:hypothetical protein